MVDARELTKILNAGIVRGSHRACVCIVADIHLFLCSVFSMLRRHSTLHQQYKVGILIFDL